MAMDFGFTKWNRGLTSGLPMDSPLLDFGTVKNSLGLCELDKNRPCEMNGLSCVEIDRLIHELNVLTRSHNCIKHNYVSRPLEMEL